MSDWKKHAAPAVIGMAVGILTTYALVWRDVAVIKSEMKHIQEDISLIQKFISDDDPRAFIEAKEKIRAEHEKDKKE